MRDKNVKVGLYDPHFNRLLGISLDRIPIYRSKGLKTHMMKQKHYKAVDYIDRIPEIIYAPEYIGVRCSGKGLTIEYIKCFKDNIILCAKLNSDGKSLYVATMFDIPKKKIDRFVHSGRVSEVLTDFSGDDIKR